MILRSYYIIEKKESKQHIRKCFIQKHPPVLAGAVNILLDFDYAKYCEHEKNDSDEPPFSERPTNDICDITDYAIATKDFVDEKKSKRYNCANRNENKKQHTSSLVTIM